MSKRIPADTPPQPRRRDFLRHGAALGLAGALPPYAASALAQADDLAPYRAAKINWRQAEGQEITIAVIPASYFENLITLQPQFEALTGVRLRFEKVPPGQIRQKALLDLSSKTATYATHAADPMYYPLYVSNKWVDPLDRYLNDASLTDASWFNYNDILKAWRDADSIDGKPYGIPYDGEVTVQVYRKDLYDAKGLKPADTYDQLVSNAKALHDPANRVYGLALRGFYLCTARPPCARSQASGWFCQGLLERAILADRGSVRVPGAVLQREQRRQRWQGAALFAAGGLVCLPALASHGINRELIESSAQSLRRSSKSCDPASRRRVASSKSSSGSGGFTSSSRRGRSSSSAARSNRSSAAIGRSRSFFTFRMRPATGAGRC